MLDVGTFYRENQSCLFRVWAPLCKKMVLHLVFPEDRKIEMTRQPRGYFVAEIENLPLSTLYFYMPDGEKDYPDPASHFQPEGVHGPSRVVDHNSFSWKDRHWSGIPREELIFYELHVGTFTPEGTFEAIIPRLQELKETGINALQLLPVAQFPGNRNWGYDGVYPYAVQDSYGGPEGLKKLVDAAHLAGIAVFLDVVYNHLGPEGNYLEAFGPYFNDHYKTPWGRAINFDNAYSDGVRAYFSDNVLYWAQYFHIDGLRFDAIHEIYDRGAVPVWELIKEKLERNPPPAGSRFLLVAESDLNSPRVTRSTETGGYGFDAQWLDDFHHALYVLLDKNGKERYADFGTIEQLQKAYEAGFVHSGEYVRFRRRRHGKSAAGIDGDRFIVFNQNHDQVGNRVNGERLSVLVDFRRLKLAMGALLVAPYIPMLFMGEEYGEDIPFYYFVSHSDPELNAAVSKGRKEFLSEFNERQQAPDPNEAETFALSKLDWEKSRSGKYLVFRNWTKKLIQLRQTHPALKSYSKNDIWSSVPGENSLAIYRRSKDERHLLLILLNFSEENVRLDLPSQSRWGILFDSGDRQWQSDYEGGAPTPPPTPVEGRITMKPLGFTVLERYFPAPDEAL